MLLSPLKIKNGLIVGDLFKFISDYISQQEKKDKLLDLYRNLSMETNIDERMTYWNIIDELEEELK